MLSLETREKLVLLRAVRDVQEFCSLTPYKIMQIVRRAVRFRHFDLQRWLFEARRDVAYCTAHNITVCMQPNLPYQLRSIENPPYALFFRGVPPRPEERMIGVVGTRKPSNKGKKASVIIGKECALAGFTLVSGLALGIDGIAMGAALAHGGRVVAVLGNGIDSVYPNRNRELADAILASGGLVTSEYPPGQAPIQYHFPARNRIINGLSSCVVLVEAPRRSGALITADFALKEGRELYVHTLPLASRDNVGARHLVAAGVPTISSIQETALCNEEGTDTDNPMSTPYSDVPELHAEPEPEPESELHTTPLPGDRNEKDRNEKDSIPTPQRAPKTAPLPVDVDNPARYLTATLKMEMELQ